MFAQVLSNFAWNAIKFTEEGSIEFLVENLPYDPVNDGSHNKNISSNGVCIQNLNDSKNTVFGSDSENAGSLSRIGSDSSSKLDDEVKKHILRVSVRDTGMGISESTIPKLFQVTDVHALTHTHMSLVTCT